MRALVIGGGIGGLTAGVALNKAGIETTVLERTSRLEPIGSGISLWPNAFAALDAVGVGDAVRAAGTPQVNSAIRDHHGKVLIPDANHHGDLYVLHRALLSEALEAALPAGALRLNSEVGAVRANRDGVEVDTAHGTERADVLIAADGIWSRVRTALWDAPAPVYSGASAWRMISDLPDLPISGESWGDKARFGYTRLPGGKVYAFADLAVPAGGHENDLAQRYAGWHAPIGEILAAADPASLIRHDIHHLPPLASFVDGTGRVALLGDAAHAMTPDLGQGAGQAMEDAVTLAACLRRDGVAGLWSYDDARRARVQGVAADSLRLCRLFTALPGWAARLALRSAPKSSMEKRMGALLGWRAPVL
ncbi:monooxygenase [Actinorhabdospora filicis]|uniref:Monooxygenase n=1 Tax=Actinorhabdospora filicis TaxID=1785913 RepID=A0A9W6WDA5_9ACTN|nr:FAD-dependent monooxygenase [Actinorhabdospora filicis]GLZ80615.1 monooxygenase [Actinorhabdospora filicis]